MNDAQVGYILASVLARRHRRNNGGGHLIVETLEEVIEGLSFVAYRRVSTTIVTAGEGYGQGARQVITIDPRDLEAAQEQDAQTEIFMGPLAHLVAR